MSTSTLPTSPDSPDTAPAAAPLESIQLEPIEGLSDVQRAGLHLTLLQAPGGIPVRTSFLHELQETTVHVTADNVHEVLSGLSGKQREIVLHTLRKELADLSQ